MPASAVSEPTLVTSTVSAPEPLVEPPMTDDPADFAHRRRLSGDERLVHVGCAVDDLAVHRHGGSRTHEHVIADLQLAHRDRAVPPRRRVVAVQQLGLVGQQLRELAERVLRAHHRGHLDPVAEQHDRDEGRELPPEVHARQAERDGERVAERDHDRERDERHHAGLLRAQLGDRAPEEHEPAVDEDREAEHRGDVLAAREARAGEPEDVLEPLREHERRDREDQAQPELAAELGGIVGAVVAVRA